MARMTIGSRSKSPKSSVTKTGAGRNIVVYSDHLVAGIVYRHEGNLADGLILTPEDRPYDRALGYITARDFTNYRKSGSKERSCVGVQVTSLNSLGFEALFECAVKNIPIEESYDDETGAVTFRLDLSSGYVQNRDFIGQPYGDEWPIRRVQPKKQSIKIQNFTSVQLQTDLVNAIEFMKEDGESINDFIVRKLKG